MIIIYEYLAFVNRKEAESMGIHWSFPVVSPVEIDNIKDKYAISNIPDDFDKALFNKLRQNMSYMAVIVAGN